jgi:Xaa-Pro aminopeptidase
MHSEQRERAHELLRRKGIERALFASAATVRWLSGFTAPIQLGDSAHSGGPPLLWYDDGCFILIVLNAYLPEAASFAQEPNCAVESYLGYTVEAPVDGARHLGAVLARTVGNRLGVGRIGVEERRLTQFLGRALTKALSSDTEFVAIDGWLEPLRMIKTDEEVRKLRDNFKLTDIGHAAARRAVQVGKREIDIWTEAHSAIERAAGRRVPLGNDCIVGHRQANIGGWPTDLVIEQNDSVIVDLSTLLHGYWSDSCATYYASEPTRRQIEMHRTAERSLEFAISLVRPGVIARDIDQKVRQFIADAGHSVYPHHTGHGVGVTGHEGPRLVPYSEEVLQAGMVIMLEPGIYFPGETSVRLEDGLLITADGSEILTHHDKSLP